MMQLARELKTLAREFSLAVVVSVAVPCHLCAGTCHGEEPWRSLGVPGKGGTLIPARQEQEACIPWCSAP